MPQLLFCLVASTIGLAILLTVMHDEVVEFAYHGLDAVTNLIHALTRGWRDVV